MMCVASSLLRLAGAIVGAAGAYAYADEEPPTRHTLRLAWVCLRNSIRNQLP